MWEERVQPAKSLAAQLFSCHHEEELLPNHLAESERVSLY